MKKNCKVVLLLFAILIIPAASIADFYVIAGGGSPPGTEIKTLPYTINASGFYYLKKDLSAAGPGISVNSDNVTIDFMGHSIIGSGTPTSGNGILISGRANVEIRNGSILNFGSHGIHEAGSSNGKNHRVINMRISGNYSGGIKYYLVYNCLIKDCTVTDNLNEQGIAVGYHSKVTGCISKSNGGTGIATDYGCNIFDNVANLNAGHGISTSSGSTIRGNTTQGNAYDGISAAPCCVVENNSACGNTNDGIQAGGGSVVRGNTASHNHQYGLNLYSQGYLIDANIAMDNNQSAGGYANVSTCMNCTFGINHFASSLP